MAPPEPPADETHPQVEYDATAGNNFHMDPDGTRCDHGVPEGFTFNAEGELEPSAPGRRSDRKKTAAAETKEEA